MSDCVDAPEGSVQPSGINPTPDRVSVETRCVQVADRDDSMLPSGDPGHEGIRAVIDAFLSHTETKASNRWDSPPAELCSPA
jgi:hypothetical protein